MGSGFYKMKICKMISSVCAIAIAISLVPLNENINAATDNGNAATSLVENVSSSNNYREYIKKFDEVNSTANIMFKAGDFSGKTDTSATKLENYTDSTGKEYGNVLQWSDKKGTIEYSVEIPENGFYNIEMVYHLAATASDDAELALKIDGNAPFAEAAKLEVPAVWKNNGDIREDAKGNQFVSGQEIAEVFNSRAFYDTTGGEIEPYKFWLSKGTHTISFAECSQPIIIAEIVLNAPKEAKKYSELKKEYKEKNYKYYDGKDIVLEGEDADYRASREIIAKADNGSPKVTPSSPDKELLNYIGGSSWKTPNQEVSWIINVKKSGLYKLGFSYKQDQTINGYSYRTLKIDNEIPFEEAKCLKFFYNLNWDFYSFSDENGEPYYIYLSEGQHTFSLTATLGEISENYLKMSDIATKLGDFYIDIMMITGETPDANRDYELFKQIPHWDSSLKEFKVSLKELSDDMNNLGGKQGNMIVAAIDNMERVIKNMEDNPYTAQNFVSDYYSCYTVFSSWLYDMKSMPLSIDQIHLVAPEEEFKPNDVNFFGSLMFSVKKFLFSFTKDYDSISEVDSDAKNIKLWINWGRDQAKVLNNLIDETFSDYAKKELGYDVNVNLQIVNCNLIKGILAGNAPDISIQMARSEPINLAMRGALYDLKQFDDYSEVVKRFGDSACVPYEYNDGVYALPDQQSFYIMFYRSDILKQLNLEVPQTWSEFLAATSALQRNNMNAYIPYTKITAATTVDMGVGGLNMFATILQQFGGKFYNDEKNLCVLDNVNSLSAFNYWTNMYIEYKLPTEADFYNRFRLGSMPLGIATYTTYTTLSAAAPEISGRWGIALIPGIKDETTGEINRTVSGAGTGCAILNDSKEKDAAWAFLKWWTSAETQTSFNNNVEAILGVTSRITTANIEAFENMAWDSGDLRVLLEQRKFIEEIPEVPGSYYVARSVDQAFWNVVSNNANPKDTMLKWSKIASEEIDRKIKEYN